MKAIAHYWSQQRKSADGRWLHPEDVATLDRVPHPFNLDHPVVPFVGDVCAPVVILGANPRYSEATPMSFAEEGAVENAMKQVVLGRTTRWACRVSYYTTRNYWEWLRSGRAVVVNACPYRSRTTKVSTASSASWRPLGSRGTGSSAQSARSRPTASGLSWLGGPACGTTFCNRSIQRSWCPWEIRGIQTSCRSRWREWRTTYGGTKARVERDRVTDRPRWLVLRHDKICG